MANGETGTCDYPFANLCFHRCCGVVKQSKIAHEKYHAYVVLSAKHYSGVCRGADVAGICESSHGLAEPFNFGSAGSGVLESFLLKRRFTAALFPEFIIGDWSWYPDHDGFYAGNFV